MIRFRKKYVKTSLMDIHNLETQRVLCQKYGLRNKKQIKKAQYMVSKYKRVLRVYEKNHPIVKSAVDKLVSLGVIEGKNPTNEIHRLKVEDILNRRLQTLVSQLKSVPLNQARQLITHGHIRVNGIKKRMPCYLIRKTSEIS